MAIRYFFAYPAIRSVVGPGTGSAMSYQCGSCEGQKYGPLKTSWSPRIWTPFFPASSMKGMCLEIASSLTCSIGVEGSDVGVAHWIRPPMSLRGIVTSCHPERSEGSRSDRKAEIPRPFGPRNDRQTSEPPADDRSAPVAARPADRDSERGRQNHLEITT